MTPKLKALIDRVEEYTSIMPPSMLRHEAILIEIIKKQAEALEMALLYLNSSDKPWSNIKFDILANTQKEIEAMCAESLK